MDDMLVARNEFQQALTEFYDILNNYHPNIALILEYGRTTLNFLDIAVCRKYLSHFWSVRGTESLLSIADIWSLKTLAILLIS